MRPGQNIIHFLDDIKSRNSTLYYFGLFNLLAALGFFTLSFLIDIPFLGTHALYKPVKFAISIAVFTWTMAWLTSYLGQDFHHKTFSWGITLLLGFEIFYIAIQALRGQASHFNTANSLYNFLYVLMAVAAALVTFWTGYVGALFFKREFPSISSHYLWAIRIGILIFVIFSFEGFIMGARLSHTVGAPDGSEGYWFLNWSKKFGDLRISHFLGMHALQILPLSAAYVFKTKTAVAFFGLIYFFLTSAILYVTLNGQPPF